MSWNSGLYVQAGLCLPCVRPVGSPPLSLRTARIRTANHTHLPLAKWCMRADTLGCLVENSVKLHLPTRRDTYSSPSGVSLSLLLFSRHYRMCLSRNECRNTVLYFTFNFLLNQIRILLVHRLKNCQTNVLNPCKTNTNPKLCSKAK